MLEPQRQEPPAPSRPPPNPRACGKVRRRLIDGGDFGLQTVEPLDLDDEFALWPENVAVFNFWLAVQTQ